MGTILSPMAQPGLPGALRAGAGRALASPEFTITDGEFQAFRELIHRTVGIALGPSKVQLVASRLAKRLRHLGFETYGEYYRHLRTEDPDGSELSEMVNCITTNKTSFFREGHHFEFLRGQFLADLARHGAPGSPHQLVVWSAGCSTGEEPYSIAITLGDALRERPGWRATILATDVDTDVLGRAGVAQYPGEAVADLPEDVCRRHFLRGTGSFAGRVQLRREVRDMVLFRQANLAERDWPVRGPFDAIFCRNVLIYFDRPTQQRVVSQFAEMLRPGGYLFLGHSENLYGICPAFEAIGRTTYRLAARQSPASARPAAPDPLVSVPLGGVTASREPVVLRTVLGSCVAACLFDPVAGVGGMNHFLLPRREDRLPPGPGSPADGADRYGVDAMRHLVDEVVRSGADRRRIRAKAFGAAEAPWLDDARAPRENVEFVTAFLEQEGIPLVASQFGGENAIEVRFSTRDGRALVRQLGARETARVERDEGRQVGSDRFERVGTWQRDIVS